MHILNNFVAAQCFLLLLFYPDAERIISGPAERIEKWGGGGIIFTLFAAAFERNCNPNV